MERDRPVLFSNYPQRLRFHSHDDALNFGRQIVQDFGCGLVGEAEDRVQHYVQGRDYAHIELRARMKPQECHLPPCGLPFRHGREGTVEAPVYHPKPVGRGIAWAENPVVAPVSHFVEGPKGAIPSFVGFECEHEGDDVFVHVFAATSLEVVREIVRCISEEELGFPGVIKATRHSSTCVSGLVERGPQWASDPVNFKRQASRQVRMELDLAEVIACFSLYLSEGGPVILAKEGFDALFEAGDVFLRPLNHKFGAVKRVDHG